MKEIIKIVAVIGSPKGKGNGYMVVKEVERYMKRWGEVGVRVYLS